MTPLPLSPRQAGWVIFILALGAGFSVASIYYAQPLLPLIGATCISAWRVWGWYPR